MYLWEAQAGNTTQGAGSSVFCWHPISGSGTSLPLSWDVKKLLAVQSRLAHPAHKYPGSMSAPDSVQKHTALSLPSLMQSLCRKAI